jgi:hypothetical protein
VLTGVHSAGKNLMPIRWTYCGKSEEFILKRWRRLDEDTNGLLKHVVIHWLGFAFSRILKVMWSCQGVIVHEQRKHDWINVRFSPDFQFGLSHTVSRGLLVFLDLSAIPNCENIYIRFSTLKFDLFLFVSLGLGSTFCF